MNCSYGEYSECNNMQKFVRVDFDPDIDSLEESNIKAKKTAPINVKEADKPMYTSKNASPFYYVYYDYGYDNSLEPNVEYINPVDRVDNIKRLSEADKKELAINLKKVGRRAITETGFVVIAKRLFLAVNSLIKNDSRFTTVQQAYHYAIFAKKADSPEIEADEFMDIAELYIYYNCKRGKTMDADKIISPREFKTILNLCRNYNMPCKPTVFINMFLDIDTHHYGSWRMDEDLFDRTSINDALFTTDDRRTILNRKRVNEEPSIIPVDDYYNNVRLCDAIRQANNADEAYKTLEIQRFIGAEPSLLLHFGVNLSLYLATYKMLHENAFRIVIEDSLFGNIMDATSVYNRELNNIVSTIISSNSVKASDLNLNNEICDYISSDILSEDDWDVIGRYSWRGPAYYAIITLFLMKKIKDYYNSEFNQTQINTIAAVIYYYLYPMKIIYNDIFDKIKYDRKTPETAKKYYSFTEHQSTRDLVDFNLLYKIMRQMVNDGDFCSYPREFCVEKAKMLYFSKKYDKE